MKLKKLVPISLATLMSFGIISPALADSLDSNSIEKNLSDASSGAETPTVEYNYEYNGVEVGSNTPLTQQELSSLYQSVVQPESSLQTKSTLNNQNNLSTTLTNDSGPIQYVPIEGGSWVYEVQPYYRTYTNSVARQAADLLAAYILKKLPVKVTDKVWANWVVTKLLGWSKSTIQPQYVGSWVTSSWSNYDNRRNYHATLVHYKNSNYTTPTSIQYFECNYWFD